MCIFFRISSLIKAAAFITMSTVQVTEGNGDCSQCILHTAKLYKIAF